MRDWKIVVTIVGIVIFCYLTIECIGFDRLANYQDATSIVYVLAGGSALAAAKLPQNVIQFMKYFAKTSLWAGALGTLIGGINMLRGIDFAYPGISVYGSDLSIMLLTMFYGIFFSLIAYALCQDESDGK